MAKHNDTGQKAEDKVALYLVEHGFKILDRNWKTRWCEVDIVARKKKCIYFVEVKYRFSSEHGTGFDYITPSKLRKMELAAKSWVEIKGWDGEYTLGAAEVSGAEFDVELIEEV